MTTAATAIPAVTTRAASIKASLASSEAPAPVSYSALLLRARSGPGYGAASGVGLYSRLARYAETQSVLIARWASSSVIWPEQTSAWSASSS